MSGYHRYEICEEICDECRAEYDINVVWVEDEKRPEWRDEKGTIKREFQEVWNELYNGCSKKMCFVFIADCHGDSIYLCEKHLAEALELLRKAINK